MHQLHIVIGIHKLDVLISLVVLIYKEQVYWNVYFKICNVKDNYMVNVIVIHNLNIVIFRKNNALQIINILKFME